jgi:hypothetical protein
MNIIEKIKSLFFPKGSTEQQLDTVDKLVMYIAQSLAYVNETEDEEYLALRMKNGTTTFQDNKYIEKAEKILIDMPLMILP